MRQLSGASPYDLIRVFERHGVDAQSLNDLSRDGSTCRPCTSSAMLGVPRATVR